MQKVAPYYHQGVVLLVAYRSPMEMGRNTNTAKNTSLPDSSFHIPSYREAGVINQTFQCNKETTFHQRDGFYYLLY